MILVIELTDQRVVAGIGFFNRLTFRINEKKEGLFCPYRVVRFLCYSVSALSGISVG